MDFSYILHTSVVKPEALVRFGFEKSCASYLFNKSLEPEFSGFYVKILLSAEKITAEVFEKSVEDGGKIPMKNMRSLMFRAQKEILSVP